MLSRSIVLTGVVPEAESSVLQFEQAVNEFRTAGFDTFEYCSVAEQLKEKADFVKGLGCKSVFLGAITQKRSGRALGSLNETDRKQAVAEVAALADLAAQSGISKMLITSGPKPAVVSEEKAALAALKKSLEELLEKTDESIEFLIEPGDTDVQFMQLIGPTQTAVDLIESIASRRLRLVMDTSHIRQLGEDIKLSLKAARQSCSYIHMANCILKKGHVMYGDKHPLFGVADSEMDIDGAKEIFKAIADDYADEDVAVSIEIINQENEAGFAEKVLQNIRWFTERI